MLVYTLLFTDLAEVGYFRPRQKEWAVGHDTSWTNQAYIEMFINHHLTSNQKGILPLEKIRTGNRKGRKTATTEQAG